ncbi:dTDP-4-dehydrorhamnose 3,5-epimerase [uncultured Jannaschia sp.]|uniref:dTDP-4-dehydrorhamnose 3,5-epimerase n=1 Tax=uncultured Jannaschia sp. TaxID=293347 RepID=UPI00263996FF|nr:dTDP-4-dehydrorhamnose 3,5-epimerase [uncultured Jannaschia sp.]
MQIEDTELEGVKIVTPRRFGDARGFFAETWNARAFAELGIEAEFVQDNHSLSEMAGTIRGLHFQAPPHGQAKLVRCGRGRLFDVAVDIRAGSPTYGRWTGAELSAENGRMLWIPEGFAHGFVTREPATEIVYKCTGFYSPEADGGVRWDSCGIDWGLTGEPILSDKDATAPPLGDFQTPFADGATQA